MKKVDVVIPVYNGERYIQECLDSVFNQTYPICHVIVVDDGSTDGTMELLQVELIKRQNLRVISGENRGVSDARNQGIQLVDSDYVAFLDCDDFWLKDKIANQVNAFETSKHSYVGVASQYFTLGERGLFGAKSPHGVVTRNQLITLESTLPGSASSVLIDLRRLPQLPKFESGLAFGEDLDFWIQCAQLGDWYVTKYVDVVIRSNPDGAQIKMLSKPEEALRSMRYVLNKNRSLLGPVRFYLVDGYLFCVFLKGFLRLRKSVTLKELVNLEPRVHLRIILGSTYYLYLKIRFFINKF